MKPKGTSGMDPAMAMRLRSAWIDPEINHADLRKRFQISLPLMAELTKELGPRKRATKMTPRRLTDK